MQKLFWSALTIGLVGAVSSWISADDGGWKMPNLNPFSSKSGTPTSSRGAQPPTSGWKAPKLWPQAKASPARKKASPNQPSTFSRMTNGTQKMLSQTADALTPWDNKKPAPPPKITGSNSIFSQNANKKAAKKDSEVQPASWWSGSKADNQDKSVNDFLSRQRPH